MILRAYAKYLRQAGSDVLPAYMERVLLGNVRLSRLLVRLFEARLDPRRRDDGAPSWPRRITEEILGALDEVASLDEDRILRAYLEMIQATLRTNYFQTVDGTPQAVHLAEVRPAGDQRDCRCRGRGYEIFVYSPRVEGVHLRFGKVARGGLRWSDRPEDFRTEILGLVKAQDGEEHRHRADRGQGRLRRASVCPTVGDRGGLLAEGVACYRMFISGLLDVTDNLVGGEVVPPPDVVRHDGDDTYLVVAADKGTATFSDIANGIAKEYGFWLGDAFASGGSIGYDHKGMGITARGAWESVKYHFRTLDVDVQTPTSPWPASATCPATCSATACCCRGTSGWWRPSTTGTSSSTPTPTPARCFAERQRLFELPRSSWADYDTALISAGGGVCPRTAKSIQITPQMRDGARPRPRASPRWRPNELISAILRAPVDLLWNGGIGTYVKASAETHADVGDKANDAVRVNAADLRCKVVGEGGNLGLTQLARIEFALNGGLVNTDFIDNSAGVDTSDHEVNIKILLDQVVRDGELTDEQRNEVLHLA